MKFSIQEEGKEKQIFFTFQSASQATGIPSTAIHYVLKKKATPIYRRRKDGVKFIIINEEEEPFATINGKDYKSFEDVETDFGISRTLFINQLLVKKNHFLDSREISHEVEKSDELEAFLDRVKKLRMCAKIEKCVGMRAKLPGDPRTLKDHMREANGIFGRGFASAILEV